MIIVTGLPRCGTSLMMQTLKLLGIPIVGDKFSKLNIPEFNPGGYYELALKYLEDVHPHFSENAENYKGKGVKVFPPAIIQTKDDYIEKLIVCERFEGLAKKSLRKYMLKNQHHITEYPSVKYVRSNYEKSANMLKTFLKRTTVPKIVIKLLDMKKNPESTIKKIMEFLNINTNMTLAVNNVIRI